MLSNLPLLHLPYLALEKVGFVMDPLEQLALYQTSQKLRNLIRSLTKDLFLHLKLNFTNGSIEFGHGEKMSETDLETVDNLIGKQRNTLVYEKNGRGDESFKDQVKAFEKVIQDLKTIFNPKAVVFHFWGDNCWLPLKPLGVNLGLIEIAPQQPKTETIFILSNSREALDRIMGSTKSRFLFFMTDENLLVNRTDLFNLLALELVVRFLKDCYAYLNGVVQNLIAKEITLRELKVSFDHEFCADLSDRFPEITKGLNATKVGGDEGYPKYQIERADGQKAMIYCTDKVFHFYNC